LSLGIDWKNIRRKIILWSFIPTVLALAAVALITFVSYQGVYEDLVIERDRELTSLSAARLREEMTKFTQLLDELARSEDLLSNNRAAQQEVLTQAGRRLAVFDGGVILLNTFGRVIATQPYRPEIIDQDWSNRSYFTQMIGSEGIIFSDALNDGPQGTRVVVLAVPVKGLAGEYHGTLAGMFRIGSQTISSFYASIVRLRLGQSGSIYLVDSRGRVIYHSDFEMIGENFSTQEVVGRVILGNTGAFRSQDTSGEDIVAAYAPVPETPWGLVSEENWVALTRSSTRYGQTLVVLLILGMILPALGVSMLVRERQSEIIERERIEQELNVARTIQKTLLPRQIPQLPGWQISAYWQPANAVGGDFYDFICFPDGKFGLVVGDVTNKGIPAALVMASTRSVLRGVAEQLESPGRVLQRVNELIYPDMPRNMFVTCLYAILDPASGNLIYANAGHNLPYWRSRGGLEELKATGMPLGLMDDMVYEEMEIMMNPGDSLLLYSDGLVEAHNGQREMFGFPRLQHLIGSYSAGGPEMIDRLIRELANFSGPNHEQEDDVTLVAIERFYGDLPDQQTIGVPS